MRPAHPRPSQHRLNRHDRHDHHHNNPTRQPTQTHATKPPLETLPLPLALPHKHLACCLRVQPSCRQLLGSQLPFAPLGVRHRLLVRQVLSKLAHLRHRTVRGFCGEKKSLFRMSSKRRVSGSQAQTHGPVVLWQRKRSRVAGQGACQPTAATPSFSTLYPTPRRDTHTHALAVPCRRAVYAAPVPCTPRTCA